MAVLMQITIGLVIVNLIILLYLGVMQLRNISRIKSPFTIGLFVFILVFFVENAVAAYFYLTMMSLYANGTEIPVFVLKLLETVAFVVYAWLMHR